MRSYINTLTSGSLLLTIYQKLSILDPVRITSLWKIQCICIIVKVIVVIKLSWKYIVNAFQKCRSMINIGHSEECLIKKNYFIISYQLWILLVFTYRDRKKKKFVNTNEQAANKKKIRTESGALISSSYKSRAYPFESHVYPHIHWIWFISLCDISLLVLVKVHLQCYSFLNWKACLQLE